MISVTYPQWRCEVIQAVLAIADGEAQLESWRHVPPVNGGLDPLRWAYDVLLESGISEVPFNNAVLIDANGEVERVRDLCDALSAFPCLDSNAALDHDDWPAIVRLANTALYALVRNWGV